MSCAQCAYFQSLPPWGRIYLHAEESFGECRRRAPVVSEPTDDRSRQNLSLFPTVKAKDWCGEFVLSADHVRQCCQDKANAAFDAAAGDDATGGAVTARVRRCEPLPDCSPTGGV